MSDSEDYSWSPPTGSSSDTDSTLQSEVEAPSSADNSPPPPAADSVSSDSSSPPPASKTSSPPQSSPSSGNPPPSESSTPPKNQHSSPPPSPLSPSQEKPSSPSPPSPTSPTQSLAPPQQSFRPAQETDSEQQSPPPVEKSAGSPPSHLSPPSVLPPTSFLSPPLIPSPPKSSSSHGQAPHLSPASTGSKAPDQTSGKGGKDGDGYRAAVGVTVGVVCVVAFVFVFCTARRRKKRREHLFANDQFIPHQNFAVKSDMGIKQAMGGRSGRSEGGYYSSYGGSQGGPSFHVGAMDSGIFDNSKTCFRYEELMELTGGFSRQNIIGEGGFGCVYKGWLPDGKAVAIKQLKAGSGQGDREFKAEVEIISRVHHRHLVSLVGYCISDQHRSLVYEFVPNNTLEHHLHGKGMPVLEWTKRMKIALGSAKGLAYLHEDCHPKIIHRDIKTANILLDDAFEALVADFGLAKLNDTSQTHVSTRVMGTFGYLAPEYASSGKLTDRSDVFSFGVVLLELITGRKPVDPDQPLGDESLVEWARPLLLHAIESGDFRELVDQRLEKQYVESEMFRMIEAAAACVRHSAAKRPRMAQVVRALDMEGGISDLSNGVKYGQSTAYDSGQYNQDIMRFRQMVLDSDDSSEYNMYSGGYSSRETSNGFTSSDSETRAINPTGGAGS